MSRSFSVCGNSRAFSQQFDKRLLKCGKFCALRPRVPISRLAALHVICFKSRPEASGLLVVLGDLQTIFLIDDRGSGRRGGGGAGGGSGGGGGCDDEADGKNIDCKNHT